MTAHEVGLALVSRVTPRVNQFGPDLIILSAGFDAHKNDPMGLGALAAEDFGHITEVACKLAFKWCSGRVPYCLNTATKPVFMKLLLY